MATQYPAQIDTTITLPPAVDNLTPIKAASVNILRDAILAIENTLGPGPASIYGTVGERLTVLENAVNSGGGGGNFTAGGDLSGTSSHQTVVGLQGFSISPFEPITGYVLAWNGTDWTPTPSAATFVASGDLSGSSTDQTVVGLQGHPVSSTSPTTGYVLTWNGSTWLPEATGASFTPGGDLGGTSTSQIVEGLYSHPLASTSPSQSYVPVWDTASSHYSIRQLTSDDIGAGFSITGFSGGSTVEIGATVTNPSFTASYSSTPASANITNTDSIDSPLTLTNPFTSGTVVGSFHHTSQASVGFTLTAVSSSTKTAGQNINFYPRVFGGVGASGATSTVTASGSTAVLSTSDVLANEGLTSSSVGATYGPFNPSAQKMYLLLVGGSHVLKDPSTNTVIPITAGGPTAVSFTNQNSAVISMYLYETFNTLTGTFSILVSS